jgi:hypothetical protein
VNKLDQLTLQVRTLMRRIDQLEAALASRPARRTKAPRPSDAVVVEREKLWARYIELEMRFGHGRTKLSKLAFAIKHHLNPDEFCRWFSATDKRGVSEGSAPDRNIRRDLAAAIAELEARKKGGSVTTSFSHGSQPSSQDSAARLQQHRGMETIEELQATEAECLKRFRLRASEIRAQHPEMSASICFAKAVTQLVRTADRYQHARMLLQWRGVPALPLR